jgi:hypothetical protein
MIVSLPRTAFSGARVSEVGVLCEMAVKERSYAGR